MLVSELITQINAAFRGDEEEPTAGTAEYSLWLATANRKISEWARDPHQQWKSLFEIRAEDTITTAASYNLDTDLLEPSDRVHVVATDSQKHYFNIYPADERDRYNKGVYIAGANPQVLTFINTIAADDPIVGGTLYVPGYFLPSNLTDAAETVPVDDPYWLVYSTASELAFNDVSHEEKYVDLNVKANNLYQMMITANNKGTSGNPRTARYNVTQRLGMGERLFRD